MKPSRLLSLTAAVAGATAAAKVLRRRYQWEQTNNCAAICVDFDDAQAAAIRAGLPFADMLARLAEAGATHVSLPEWTLSRLLSSGQLTPQAPTRPHTHSADIGHWNYLHGEVGLVSRLATELQARLPQTETAVLDSTTLVFAGNIPIIGEIGLGFDLEMAGLIRQYGLGVVPRPVSYAWPDPTLLARTLAQAAQVGQIVAFAGDMILGHEMHLDATVQALVDNDLTFVFFAESRHQKGDWFIAKRRAPHILLGHRLTPADMVPLDYHAACHNWAYFARERGIRFCYINFFRVLHATAPLEGLDYVHHLRHALEDAGLKVETDPTLPQPIPAPTVTELAAAGAAAGSVGATAVSRLLQLPESVALPLTVIATTAATAIPHLEKLTIHNSQLTIHNSHDHDHHHDHDHDHANLTALYPPSYAPKLLALGAAALGPIAARDDGLSGMLYYLAATTALTAVSSGPEYQLRIEEFRGFNLDWLLPLAAAVGQLPDKRTRLAGWAALTVGWLAAQKKGVDLLAQIDPGHAQGHTHHISKAMAWVGDMQMAVGPKPARKWTGLGPLAGGLGVMLARNDRFHAAAAAQILSALGYVQGMTGFRRPERSLVETGQLTGQSLGMGTAVGLLLNWMSDEKSRD